MVTNTSDGSTIRRAELADVDRIGEIARVEQIETDFACELAANGCSIVMTSTHRDPPHCVPNWDDAGVKRRAAWWKRSLNDGGLGFVTEWAGKLSGIAILGPERHGRCAEIVAMFVDAGQRGTGLGKRLLQMLEDPARERSIEALYLGSNENANALGFYQHMGFRIVCLMDPSIVWIPGLETAITVAKRL